MNPPFTSKQFFDVLVDYNESVWPAQLVWVTLALLAIALTLRGSARADRTIAAILSLLWLWMGIVYHWLFFVSINPAAVVFGAAFVVEGILLLIYGFRKGGLRFAMEPDVFGIVGGCFAFYALVLYPIFAVLLEHRYPEQPTFGLPCPGTIFTMGILLWGRPRVPWVLVVIPVLWSIIGSSAVGYFGVIEDAMLPVAAIGGAGLILWKNRREVAA